MDIATMSIGMHQASLQSTVSISVMKIAMNSGIETSARMTDMMSNTAIDTSKGINIDTRV